MSVDPVTAVWLKSDGDNVIVNDAAIDAAWGELAHSSSIASPLSERADAVAEAARQCSMLAYAIVPDRVLVQGLRVDLIGRRIDLTADHGDLAATRCIVIQAEEQPDVEQTVLTVIRRLA